MIVCVELNLVYKLEAQVLADFLELLNDGLLALILSYNFVLVLPVHPDFVEFKVFTLIALALAPNCQAVKAIFAYRLQPDGFFVNLVDVAG